MPEWIRYVFVRVRLLAWPAPEYPVIMDGEEFLKREEFITKLIFIPNLRGEGAQNRIAFLAAREEIFKKFAFKKNPVGFLIKEIIPDEKEKRDFKMKIIVYFAPPT